jgi:hypothetical protein
VLSHWCPACDRPHAIELWRGPRKNEWDHNSMAPSFTGEIRQQSGDVLCIYRITAGRIQYLEDCGHILAGRTVALPVYPHNRS